MPRQRPSWIAEPALRALEHPPLEYPVGVLEDLARARQAGVTCEVEISAHVLDGAFRRPLGGARRSAGRELQAVPSSVGTAAGNRYLPETESSLGNEVLGVHFLGQVLAFRDAVIDDQAGELRGGRLGEQLVAERGEDAIGTNHQVEPPARPVAEDQLHARLRFVDIDDRMVQVYDAGTGCVSEYLLQRLPTDADQVLPVLQRVHRLVQQLAVRQRIEPLVADGGGFHFVVHTEFGQRVLRIRIEPDRPAAGRQRCTALVDVHVGVAMPKQTHGEAEPADTRPDNRDRVRHREPGRYLREYHSPIASDCPSVYIRLWRRCQTLRFRTAIATDDTGSVVGLARSCRGAGSGKSSVDRGDSRGDVQAVV